MGAEQAASAAFEFAELVGRVDEQLIDRADPPRSRPGVASSPARERITTRSCRRRPIEPPGARTESQISRDRANSTVRKAEGDHS